MKYSRLYITLAITCLSFISFSQGGVIDKVVGIVGDEMILNSSIEMQYHQYVAQGMKPQEDFRCTLLKSALEEKLLIHQAKIDSIEVSEDEVEGELDRRIRYFTSMFGSQEQLEEYYKKSIIQIKDEFREDIKNQLMSNRVRGNITRNVAVTPSAVKEYFEALPEDSIPHYNAQVEIGQITIKPKITVEQDSAAYKKLAELKKRIDKGEKFETLALLYSQDPGSAAKGGELGFMARGTLVPEFEEVAYQLKPDEVSDIVKSDFGYHIIQLIKRRGESVNARHILIKTKFSGVELRAAEKKADSIRSQIIANQITFEKAVARYSDDEVTNGSGGLFMNQETASTFFDMDDVDPQVYFQIEKLKPGEFSKVSLFADQRGEQAYRFIYLKSATTPHKASLETDYEKIKQMAIAEKERAQVHKWYLARIKKNYVFIHDDFLNCSVLEEWKPFVNRNFKNEN